MFDDVSPFDMTGENASTGKSALNTREERSHFGASGVRVHATVAGRDMSSALKIDVGARSRLELTALTLYHASR